MEPGHQVARTHPRISERRLKKVPALSPSGNAGNRTSFLCAGSTDTLPNERSRQPEGEVRSGKADTRQAAAERSGADLPSAPLLCFVSYFASKSVYFLDFESPAFFPITWTL